MRSIYKIVVCSLLTLSITSCEKDLLEKEQYQKESDELASINLPDRCLQPSMDHRSKLQ